MVKRGDRKYPFIPLPLSAWWALRKVFNEGIPPKIDATYLSVALDLELGTTRHYLLALRGMGLINDNDQPTELAYRWRVDQHYPDVCKEILGKAYPVEVRNAIAPNSSHAYIEKLIKNNLGVTDRHARLMANFYLVLSEADPTKPTHTFNPEKKISDDKPGLTRQINMGGDAKSRKVFIVHGHDGGTREVVAHVLDQLGLSPVILAEQPNQGQTIIEKFEQSSRDVNYAVVLLTPDDIGAPKNKPDDLKPRARQNVIFELGYFAAKLGRKNVCALHKGGIEIPSDYHGVVFVSMDSSDWKWRLALEIKQVMPVDLNVLS